MSSIDRIISSSAATAIAELVTLPISTLKTVYQNTDSTSITKTMKDIYRIGGLKAYFSASVPAISSHVFAVSSRYVFYRKLQDLQLSYTNNFINGTISGLVSSLFTHPMDVARIHIQMQDSISNKIKDTGVKILYQGYSKTFVKIGIGASLYLPLTDYFKPIVNNDIVLASFLGGLVGTLVIHPVDFLKTRHVYGLKLYQGLNPMWYYKGLTLNLLRTLPHFMITMTCINTIEKYMDAK